MHLREYLEGSDGRKLPAATFARLMGVATATVLRWANGTLTPSPAAMRKMYEVTKGQVRPDDMVLKVGDSLRRRGILHDKTNTLGPVPALRAQVPRKMQ